MLRMKMTDRVGGDRVVWYFCGMREALGFMPSAEKRSEFIKVGQTGARMYCREACRITWLLWENGLASSHIFAFFFLSLLI